MRLHHDPIAHTCHSLRARFSGHRVQLLSPRDCMLCALSVALCSVFMSSSNRLRARRMLVHMLFALSPRRLQTRPLLIQGSLDGRGGSAPYGPNSPSVPSFAISGAVSISKSGISATSVPRPSTSVMLAPSASKVDRR